MTVPAYEDVLHADPTALSTAAARWRAMAQSFQQQLQVMDSQVMSMLDHGLWIGTAATMARFQLLGTRGDLADAQIEANAVASLLDEAATDFAAARKKLTDATAAAAAAGYTVTGSGVAVFDTSKLDQAAQQALPQDPDSRQEREDQGDAFTAAITAALQEAGDADDRINQELRSDAKVGDTGGQFNHDAIGGGPAADGRRAAQLASRLDSLSPDQRRLLTELLHAKADDPAFSQSLLGTLGPEGTLRLADELRVPGGDKPDGDAELRTDLARSLDSATQDPNTAFYQQWRAGMKAIGTKNLGDNLSPVDGYQLLATLMQSAPAPYGSTYLQDLGQDIIDTEKADPNVWLHAVDGTRPTLAADPLDAVLGLMGRQPAAATAFLDPGTTAGADHLRYVLKDRHWPEQYMTGPGAVMDVPDAGHPGLGAALEAATTGQPAGSPHPSTHTEAEARVMHDTVSILGEQGSTLPAGLREPLANALASYSADTENILSGTEGGTLTDGVWTDANGVHMGGQSRDLSNVMRGIADDPTAFDQLRQAEASRVTDLLVHTPDPGSPAWQTAGNSAFGALGAYDAIQADAIMTKRDDAKDAPAFDGKITTDVISGVAKIKPWDTIGRIPVADWLGKAVDLPVSAYVEQQQHAIAHQASEAAAANFSSGETGVDNVVDTWAMSQGLDPNASQVLGIKQSALAQYNSRFDATGRNLGWLAR
ncbi:hypothetical protein OG455_16390 [Kitasatospora sp. NBC_01287]|uniref:hypothetical protein n=1 Tax=Kitasatospora sp. NBC_01287 TaxID=2903573 RepID=UPI0022551953|nr:hypothetical protein [Kitasatospora sp. NBC_01287]MCX4747083.1 hypothetical protein [Kitasatospora sp. NBC_01287]